MEIKLSILDQTPIFEGETAELAFRHTIELAQAAEKLGYHRFWVSEHHDSEKVAGASPEVLISHLLAKTERIRIGSGGVMLQHYSPYKVAENFNVLSSLAPGRVDLGIGRAPGGLPRSTQALQQGPHTPLSLTEKIKELQQFLHNRLEHGHPLFGLRVQPAPRNPADIYMLGTSEDSAAIAAELGLPYVFSLFINGDQQTAYQALTSYRIRFQLMKSANPAVILAISVIAADTDEEAKELAGELKLFKIHLKSGKTITVTTEEQAEEFGRQSCETNTIEVAKPAVTIGSKETVRRTLLKLAQMLGVNEFMVLTPIPDFSKRLRSFQLLKEAFAEVPTDRRM